MYRIFKYLKRVCTKLLFVLLCAVLCVVLCALSLRGQCPPRGCGGSCDSSGGWVVVDDSAALRPSAGRSHRVTDAKPAKVTPPNAGDYAPDTPVAGAGEHSQSDVTLPKPPPVPPRAPVPPTTAPFGSGGEAEDANAGALSALSTLSEKVKKLDALLEKFPTADELKANAELQGQNIDAITAKITSDLKSALAEIPPDNTENFSQKLEEISASLEMVRSEQTALKEQMEETQEAAAAPESNAKLKLAAVILQILFCSGILMAVIGWVIAMLWRVVKRMAETYRTGRSLVLAAAESVKEKIIEKQSDEGGGSTDV